MRVKICGITRPEDLRVCVEAGADAVGFVFAPRSARCLKIDAAADLVRSVPGFVARVGLFMDQDCDTVAGVLRQVPLSHLQFHGREDGRFCRGFGLPYLRAVAMAAAPSLAEVEAEFADAAALLLDSHQPGEPGGTGRSFDWSALPPTRLPIVLAGGLTPENVARAVRQARPWGVDVSSGVEDAPGVKNADRIMNFISEAKREY